MGGAARSNQAAPEPTLAVARVVSRSVDSGPRDHSVDGVNGESAGVGSRIPAGREMNTRVLLVSERADSQLAFSNLGYHVTFVDFTRITASSSTSMLENFRDGEFDMLWICMLSMRARDRIGEGPFIKKMSTVKAWMEVAKRSRRPGILSGPFGKVWRCASVSDMMVQGTATRSTRNWCHWDVRLWEPGSMDGPRDLPSSRRHVLMTTFTTSSCLCQCPPIKSTITIRSKTTSEVDAGQKRRVC